ncbi:MAG: hypothetical protein IKF19_06640 [Bacilli bacterium]|nr:hypothetical protein [Bacilli bacterium]
MEIKYKITEYFEKKNLFSKNQTTKGLKIKEESNSLLISGNSRDLVQLADLLVNVALAKEKTSHLHIDNLTILDDDSDYHEIILEKI